MRLKLLSGIVNSSASRVEALSNNKDNNANNNANSDASNTLETCLSFLVEGMAFLNAFVQSAPDLRHQVVIQWEVEEAALNIDALSQVRLAIRKLGAKRLKSNASSCASGCRNHSEPAGGPIKAGDCAVE